MGAEKVGFCAVCGKLCDPESDMYCEDCAQERGVCAACGELLDRRIREDYTMLPYCPVHF